MKICKQLLICLVVFIHESLGSELHGSQPNVQLLTVTGDSGYEEYEKSDMEFSRSVRDARTSGQPTNTRPMPASDLRRYQGATKHIQLLSSKPSAYRGFFKDPGWSLQWYAQDYRDVEGPVMDHNLVPAYRKGYNGLGVTVAIVDGGVESSHKDLKPNFDEDLSYDLIYNRAGSGFGSMTLSYEQIMHATRVAGVVAMAGNNDVCGVGVAYKAKIASIRLIHPQITDAKQAKGLVMHLNKIDIYSCSWGNSDSGYFMRSLPALTAQSFAKGATEGRGGKGAIYVFGTGVGKGEGDNCGADSYVNNQYTIPIASATQNGKVTWYGERCPAIMATAYGSGYTGDELVYTTDTSQRCTSKFSGNSPSTPIASGIIALALQANPELTYRDVMHLIAMSSEVAPLADNRNSWRRNGAGFWVSHDFGFGLFNAENMVTLAEGWKRVPPLVSCDVPVPVRKPQYISNKNNEIILKVKTDACHRSQNGVYFLESFQLNATIEYTYRGALYIAVESPKGTPSKMLRPRKLDKSREGLKDWTMKSNHAWGEDPYGEWTVTIRVEIEQKGGYRGFLDYLQAGFKWETVGAVKELNLRLHGTAESPYGADPRLTLPRRYSAFRLPDGQTSEDLSSPR